MYDEYTRLVCTRSVWYVLEGNQAQPQQWGSLDSGLTVVCGHQCKMKIYGFFLEKIMKNFRRPTPRAKSGAV